MTIPSHDRLQELRDILLASSIKGTAVAELVALIDSHLAGAAYHERCYGTKFIGYENPEIAAIAGGSRHCPGCIDCKPTPPPAADTFDAAVAAELPSAALVGSECHEVCKRFAGELRKRFAAPPQPASQARDDDLLDLAAMLENELEYERKLLESPNGGGSRIAVGRHERWLAAARRAISALSARETQPSDELKAAMRAGATCLCERGQLHIYDGGKTYARGECIAMSRLLEAAAGAP